MCIQKSVETDGDFATTPYVPGLPASSQSVVTDDTARPTSGKPNDVMPRSSAADVSRLYHLPIYT